MFDKVLVGVDGRQGGRDAIALAQQLAAPGDKLVLANVYGPRVPGGALATPEHEAEELLERESRQMGVQAAESVVFAAGKPGRGLQDLAERESADLLVIGSTHRGPVGRVLLGDATLKALNGAPCAVAVAPAGYAETEHKLGTIGVGHDGSNESELALTAARSLAGSHDSALRVLAVVSLQTVPSDTRTPLDWTHETERVMKAEQARVDAIEGVSGEVAYGDPSEELAAFAKDLDLLIVGSRGQGPIGRLLSGSSSTYLARRCPCPLIVVPSSVTEPRSQATAA
jgi:nucleotide-binding universal stress UspA family protein